ncbi:MAG TPA: DUF1440 domain-containing protein [Gaiellaceae bacterium]|jgi:uncharacterized membrane protein YagU involved in acid resistance
MRNPEVTPLGAVARGVAAGIAGTAAFTAYQGITSRVIGNGGGSRPPRRWADAPAPAQVAKRVLEGLFDRRTTLKEVPVITQAMHWGYGIGWGAVYGLVHESFDSRPLVHGAALGTLVVATDYTVLPAMGVYEPATSYPARTLAVDLAHHVVFGLAVAGAYSLLERGRDEPSSRARRALRIATR